jgi:hypothetical protein
MDWLIHQRSEMEKIFWLIKGSQLKMLGLAKIEMLTASLCVPKKKKGCCFVCNFYIFARVSETHTEQLVHTYVENPISIATVCILVDPPPPKKKNIYFRPSFSSLIHHSSYYFQPPFYQIR